MLWFPPNCKCHTVTVSETESECDNVKKRLQPQAGPGVRRPAAREPEPGSPRIVPVSGLMQRHRHPWQLKFCTFRVPGQPADLEVCGPDPATARQTHGQYDAPRTLNSAGHAPRQLLGIGDITPSRIVGLVSPGPLTGRLPGRRRRRCRVPVGRAA
jgi:hypothetical protein